MVSQMEWVLYCNDGVLGIVHSTSENYSLIISVFK